MTLTQTRSAVTAELTKIRTVRSTVGALLTAVVLSWGLAYLIGLSFSASLSDPASENPVAFDPIFAAFYSLTIAQLPLAVFAVLVVGAEHSTGTIHSSLAAIPRRGVFYASKTAAAAVPLLGAAILAAFGAFFISQTALGEHGVAAIDDGVPRALFGAVAYLTLIGLFSLGVAAALRSTAGSLAVLLPLLFLGGQGLGNVPGINAVTQYLPDQTGAVIIHLAGPQEQERWARDYGPWTGLALMVLWTVAALVIGWLATRRRDA